jgi:hypothetical protein
MDAYPVSCLCCGGVPLVEWPVGGEKHVCCEELLIEEDE